MDEETLKQRCERLEHYVTPEWAASAILRREVLTPWVIDPCAGTGVLTRAAEAAGYSCTSFDIEDWKVPGFEPEVMDWLTPTDSAAQFIEAQSCTILMNPPFSKATEFVEQSFRLGARKVVCFQRFAFWESRKRRDFWGRHPPSKVYICGDRANCWRHDLPEDKRASSTTTAHAWFVFEAGHGSGTLLDHIWKDDANG